MERLAFYIAFRGRLTRVRVARQAALSASQCCCGSCKRDAVIILREKKILIKH